VRYPDSAVLRAVSALPFLAPWAEIKYSIGVNHSRRDALIGSSIISPEGDATSPFIPAICVSCPHVPLAHESMKL